MTLDPRAPTAGGPMVPTALTDLPTRTWTNWVGNQSFAPPFAAAPRHEE